jgi:hypothetical protein
MQLSFPAIVDLKTNKKSGENRPRDVEPSRVIRCGNGGRENSEYQQERKAMEIDIKKSSLKTFVDGNLYESEVSRTYINHILRLSYSGNEIGLNVTVDDVYPFVALQKMRLELGKRNALLMCKGARTDVYPSGGQMSGVGALQLVMGRRAKTPDDVVNIFDPEDDVSKLGTVDEQKAYYSQWVESISGLPY